jgi:hypothetical protein
MASAHVKNLSTGRHEKMKTGKEKGGPNSRSGGSTLPALEFSCKKMMISSSPAASMMTG